MERHMHDGRILGSKNEALMTDALLDPFSIPSHRAPSSSHHENPIVHACMQQCGIMPAGFGADGMYDLS
jgi:hypothetical protein